MVQEKTPQSVNHMIKKADATYKYRSQLKILIYDFKLVLLPNSKTCALKIIF